MWIFSQKITNARHSTFPGKGEPETSICNYSIVKISHPNLLKGGISLISSWTSACAYAYMNTRADYRQKSIFEIIEGGGSKLWPM